MSSKGLPEMITGVWHVKWWKYRYILLAALLVNLLLINRALEGRLNPFRSETGLNSFEGDLAGHEVETIPKAGTVVEESPVELPFTDISEGGIEVDDTPTPTPATVASVAIEGSAEESAVFATEEVASATAIPVPAAEEQEPASENVEAVPATEDSTVLVAEQEPPVTEDAAPATEESPALAAEQEPPVTEDATPATEDPTALAAEQEAPVAEDAAQSTEAAANTDPATAADESSAASPTPLALSNGTFVFYANISTTSTPPLTSSSSSSSTSMLPTRTRKPSPVKVFDYATVVPSIPSSSKHSSFNLHDYEFNGQYVGWPLEQLCKDTEWVPGLTFICDNNSGGIGNIRNFILTCIRYAIDAGASELILPRIQRRSEDDLANIFTAGFQPFSYFFDEVHFRYVFNKHCPQMKVYNTTADIPFAENLEKIEEFYPKDLNKDLDGCDGRGVNRHLDLFKPKFHNYLANQRNLWPSEEDPVTIRFKWATFFEWPIYRDGSEFATTFGDILRFRKDIEELAGIALAEMSYFTGTKPRPDKFEAPYIGVHLRTEQDSLDFWPSFDEQTDGYLWQAKIHGLRYAYLACGDPKEAARFAEKAWNNNQLRITTKLELLKGENRKRLDALSWDQQALVDFLVLEKSAHFTGCSFSSFAMNIAIKRHSMNAGIQTRQFRIPGDKYSTLVGRFESWYDDWQFMYECMWP